jgi:hypothetical protein
METEKRKISWLLPEIIVGQSPRCYTDRVEMTGEYYTNFLNYVTWKLNEEKHSVIELSCIEYVPHRRHTESVLIPLNAMATAEIESAGALANRVRRRFSVLICTAYRLPAPMNSP